jgi:predicted amidohydrolase YtcJ
MLCFRLLLVVVFAFQIAQADEPADLLFHNGKIATVDVDFRIVSALAVRDGKITAVGTDEQVLAQRGPKTEVIDLRGKFVVPGLIDSHVHPDSAAMHEFDHSIPAMESIEDVLAYIVARAKVVPEGEWITLRQVFITRLKEQRYPTKEELDQAAPKHGVMFATGPDAMLNSLALEQSGINADFRPVGQGQIERFADGTPTGMLRSCAFHAKPKTFSARTPTEEERLEQLRKLFADYNSVGLTSVADRNAENEAVGRCQVLKERNALTVRVAFSMTLDNQGSIEKTKERLAEVARHPLRQGDDWLKVIGVKTFLDGGMLTGSAYMRQPWGVSEIYTIRDPQYRGNLFIPPERLVPMVRATVEAGLQFTAHSVGDGAIHNLLDAYAEVNKEIPVAPTRPCLTHANFMSSEAIDQMATLGVVADMQPAWLYLDAHTLHRQFGEERLRWFQPMKTLFERGVIVGGGSDHMQRIGSLRSVNPYNPFLGMWTTITRQSKHHTGSLHPEEALGREQALRFYTRNNAYLLFREQEIGSLEPGKWADLVILDRDLLTCPIDDLKETQVVKTFVAGKEAYSAK